MAIVERFTYQGMDAMRVGRFKGAVNTTFVLYRIDDTLIDTGPSNQWRFVRRFIAEKPMRQVLVTHHHEDHSGNCASIRDMTGLTPLSSPLCVRLMAEGYSIPWLQHLVWGPQIKAQLASIDGPLSLSDGAAIEVIAAPGHAPDLICYLVPERGWLFSADLFIARTVKYLRFDEDLSQLLTSLKRVIRQDFDTLLCPHRGIVENGKAALQAKYDNLAELVGQAHDLSSQGLEVKEITRRLLGPEDMISRLSNHSFCKKNLIMGCLHVQPSSL